MGITVVLEDENGRKLATIDDPTNVLHRLLPPDDEAVTTQMLQYIDWYGDTVFNHLQAERFLQEWDSLASTASTGESQRVFKGIRDLAERLRSEHHVYLKFYGD